MYTQTNQYSSLNGALSSPLHARADDTYITNHKEKRCKDPFSLSRRQEGEKGKALVPFYCTLGQEHHVSVSLGFVRGSLEVTE